MAYGESISVTSFFNWVHVWNTGAAFSLLRMVEAGSATFFYRNRGSGLDFFLIKLILENRHKGEAIVTVLSSVAPWAT